MKKNTGFTLVELMVTLLVAGILAALAVPRFRSMLARRQVESAVHALMSDFSFARSEAIKRGHSVTICRRGSGTGATAACATTQGSWHDGWLVFSDRNDDGNRSTTEAVLREQGPLSGIASVAAQQVGGTERFVRYRPSGLALGTASHFIVTPNAAPPGATASEPSPGSRLVCVSLQGRVTLRPAGEVPPCT